MRFVAARPNRAETTRNAMKPAYIFLAVAIPAMIASAWLMAPPGTILLSLSLGALLVALAAIDIATLRLPDALTFTVLLFGVIMVALTRPDLWVHHLLGAGIGYFALVGLELAYRRLRGRDGLGRGDAKLLGAIGMWVAWPGLAPVLLVASVTGLVAALMAGLIGKRGLSGETQMAFGPWIALGGWIIWLAGPRIALVPLG
ncbi:MAG: A24 family peptidase [Hyphomonas sp.]|uniref:prepilin peptidase n=2 Tax=Hyphomonas sp. TaxID=87 RepID=UPI0032F5965F|tara:strand:+ start:3484 stop:4086 length:603 start_codon:yes stop_codon:yes gene_type:complete